MFQDKRERTYLSLCSDGYGLILHCPRQKKSCKIKHITVEQRYIISAMKEQGYKQKDIALKTGKDKSVIFRELSRICAQRSMEYKAELTQRK
ncbi:MAG: helix-turn-helix domain-containing protein [Bacteroidetes bacterium]|nr:helix-turn-helix domain-containing protein [Bacteroidota bacterium]